MIEPGYVIDGPALLRLYMCQGGGDGDGNRNWYP